ncbi:MAG TPA: ABC transporter permease, partial [Vicinamibacterales bacterium]|nr:ABC transporter permease [Vicinamibacterales bacterium]
MAGPPFVARWLLEHAIEPAAAEAIAGDLAEAYQLRIARGEAGTRARLWYWREALVAILWQWRGAPRVGESAAGRRTMSDTLFTEVRQTLRALRRAPGFSLGAIVPIALALALATSVFAVVHAVLIRPLPYPRPDRIVHIGEHDAGDRVGTIGYATTVDFREKARSFESFVAIRGWNPTLTSPATLRLSGMRVGAGYFSMLGVRPALGRDFTPDEDTPSTRYVVILSDGLWRRQFGADPNVINQTIAFGDTPFRVVGVLPASFEPVISSEFYTAAEIWSPLGYALDGDSSCRSCRHLHAVASLVPGLTPERAQDELRAMRAALAKEHPRDYGSDQVSVERISDRIAEPMRRPLAVLMAAVLLVLAIAGANAASLMIARAADLEHEHALRAALGASTGQLIRQRGIEALLLAATAGALGLAGGSLLTSWLLAQAPSTLPRADHIGVNGSVVAFVAAAVAVLTAMIALLPALQGFARPVQAAWARARSTDSRGLVRAREALIVADVAIALTLAIGAGVMIRSLDRLLAVDPGFVAADVHTVGLSLVGPRWATDPPVLAFQRDLETRMRAIPGVQSAAIASQVPLGGNYDRRGGYLEERNTQRAEDGIEFERYSISPDYLKVMGIPLLRGRGLSDADRPETTPVMLISDSAARQYWPGQDPIGKR